MLAKDKQSSLLVPFVSWDEKVFFEFDFSFFQSTATLKRHAGKLSAKQGPIL
jgi:hypothetical protein